MNFHKWNLIREDVIALLYEKLEANFQLRTDLVFMEYVNARLHNQWKHTRCDLSLHWKQNGGKSNPPLARSNMKSDCRSQEDWNHLCDYWELGKTQKYSDQMEINKGKQLHVSRGGSRSIANHAFQLTNPETQMPPGLLEMYHKMYYKAENQGWLNNFSRIEYGNIIQRKEATVNELKSEGITITTVMLHKLEKEAIDSVRGRTKTIQSAWEAGVGPVLRKKDNWMKQVAESSQRDSSETEDLRNKVIALEAQLKENNERRERMSAFMSTRYPDFDSTISVPAIDETGSDATI